MTELCPHCGQPLPETADVSFDEFWALYPRKVARKTAQAKWKKLGKRKQQAALKHLKKSPYASSDPQFIPHPTTYINQERWDDEPLPTQSHYDEQIWGI